MSDNDFTQADFDAVLFELVDESPASRLLTTIPNIYSDVSEAFNNEVLSVLVERRAEKKAIEKRKQGPTSGYVHCGCRDCFEITVGEAGELCSECIEYGCEADSECCVPPDLEEETEAGVAP